MVYDDNCAHLKLHETQIVISHICENNSAQEFSIFLFDYFIYKIYYRNHLVNPFILLNRKIENILKITKHKTDISKPRLLKIT